ncbi:MAG: GNAT family N-acetyltransferase [Actinobacteria bacterium]|nr:GNAT family N-acetyltransferase [Actinomycetota bacterium]
MTNARRIASEDLRPVELDSLRDLFDAAWPDEGDRFTDDDWDHTFGGVHFVVEDAGRIVSHASVIERELHTGTHRLRTGYVEGVATSPSHRRRGLGSAVMRDVGTYIDETFELGALGTGLIAFYERLGWIVWEGLTGVRTHEGVVPTPEEDGSILVRLTPSTPDLDRGAPINCEWRPGDVW